MTATQDYGGTLSDEFDHKTAKSKLDDHEPLLTKNVSFRVLFRKHWFATCVYCSVFCTFGVCVAILGPTLTDLGCITSSDIKAMSWVFFVQFLFVLVGSMFSGYLVNKNYVNRYETDILIMVATIVLPLTMVLVPLCKIVGLLAAVLAVMGLSMGCLDTLANVQMIRTFGEAVTPFLQAMHFFYGLGAFISPMIAEPFIYNADCSLYLHEINNYTDSTDTYISLKHPHMHSMMVNSTFVEEELRDAQEGTQVRYAFWIIGAIMIPIPILVGLLILKKSNRDMEHSSLVESDSSASLELSSGDEGRGSDDKDDDLGPGHTKICCMQNTTRNLSITIGIATMLFIYDGLQSSYGAYVYSYALKSIAELEKREGAYLNASFWGMFALGRLLSIFIAMRFNPAFMLFCDIIGSCVAMVIMMSLRHDHVALYVGTCLFGLFLSSVTPTALSLAEQYIDLSSSNTAFIVTIAATGEMIMPVIVGNAFAALGPISFLVSGNVMTFLSIFVFAFIWMKGKSSPKMDCLETRSFIWCQSYVIKRRRARKNKQSKKYGDPNPPKAGIEMSKPTTADE